MAWAVFVYSGWSCLWGGGLSIPAGGVDLAGEGGWHKASVLGCLPLAQGGRGGKWGGVLFSSSWKGFFFKYGVFMQRRDMHV